MLTIRTYKDKEFTIETVLSVRITAENQVAFVTASGHHGQLNGGVPYEIYEGTVAIRALSTSVDFPPPPPPKTINEALDRVAREGELNELKTVLDECERRWPEFDYATFRKDNGLDPATTVQ